MAVYGMNPQRTATRRGRRANQPAYDPLQQRAKHIADVLFERAKALVEVLAPEIPADAEEIPEYVQWQILEGAALSFSPAYWDNPEALEDLYRLRKQFTGYDDQLLKTLAKKAKKLKAWAPDPSITPVNPEFEKRMKRLGVK
jgi:hypothetical protein